MSYCIARFALISLVAVVAACDDVVTGPFSLPAHVRIVNAADIADVRVRLVGRSNFLAEDLDFREQTTTCVEVPIGEQAFVFTSGDVELTTAVGMLGAGQRYTVFLTAAGATRRAVVTSDDATAVAGNNMLRFVNGTSAAGDVYVTPPGTAPAAQFLAHGNMGVLATSNLVPGYVARSVDHTQARLFDPGATTNPRADIALTNLPATRLASVVFVNAGTPAGPTAFIVTPCP
jgi:hypothetical protein